MKEECFSRHFSWFVGETSSLGAFSISGVSNILKQVYRVGFCHRLTCHYQFFRKLAGKNWLEWSVNDGTNMNWAAEHRLSCCIPEHVAALGTILKKKAGEKCSCNIFISKSNRYKNSSFEALIQWYHLRFEKIGKFANNFPGEQYISSFWNLSCSKGATVWISFCQSYLFHSTCTVVTPIFKIANLVRIIDHRSVMFCDPTTAQLYGQTVEISWWSIYLQITWFPNF